MKYIERNIDLGLLILRVSIGSLMLLHGIAKLLHSAGFIEQVVVDAGLPSFLAYGVYLEKLLLRCLSF